MPPVSAKFCGGFREKTMAGNDFYVSAERRIEHLTLALGAVASVFAAFRWDARVGLGVAIGALLAWVNFRWLRQGVATLSRRAAAQVDAGKVRVSTRVYVKFFGRYALLGVVIYVILTRSLLPAGAVFGGLFVLVAAAVVEIFYELLRAKGQADSE